jgi:hypothetical protein
MGVTPADSWGAVFLGGGVLQVIPRGVLHRWGARFEVLKCFRKIFKVLS